MLSRARVVTTQALRICVMFAAGFAACLRAQPAPGIAALEQKIAAAPVRERSPLLIALSHALDSDDTTRALETARQARQLATAPHDELLADARIATVLRQRGDYPEAIAIARAALARATEAGDDEARVTLLLAFARINWSIADYPPALAGYQEAVNLAEKLGNRELAARGHLGIAITIGEMGDRDRARTEEETALKVAEEIGDRELQSDALNNLANNFYNTGDYERARALHERNLTLRTALGRRRGIADTLVNLGEVARVRHDLPAALDYTQRALVVYEQLGLKRYLANAHLQFATILRDQGDLAGALARLNLGFALASTIDSQGLAANYHREFVALHEARGDWRAAFESQQKLAAANDAVLGEKTRTQLAAYNARYDAERRQQEIALLHGDRARQDAELRAKEAELLVAASALERSNLIRLALGVSLLSLAVALGAIIGLQRVRLKAERRVLAEARAAQEAAEEADRVKTRFLGIASHDIRAPLGNIVNLTSMVRSTGPADPARGEHLDLIGAEAQRVISLVEDLITTAALETGKLELRPAPLDFAEVVRSTVESLRWQADAKRQRIVFSAAEPGTGNLVGDAARLQQVVANLLGNAIKFSPPGAAVTLQLNRADHLVTLAVSDQGAGISAADVGRLFTPFERLANHPTAAESSHGLGLSIAQEIVHRHGGRIRVESEPGQGATFIVELPAPDESA